MSPFISSQLEPYRKLQKTSFHFKSIFDTFPRLKLLPECENQLYEWKGS